MLGSCRDTEAEETKVSGVRVRSRTRCSVWIRTLEGRQLLYVSQKKSSSGGQRCLSVAFREPLHFSLPAGQSDSLEKYQFPRLEGTRNKVMTHFGSWPLVQEQTKLYLDTHPPPLVSLAFPQILGIGIKSMEADGPRWTWVGSVVPPWRNAGHSANGARWQAPGTNTSYIRLTYLQ